MFGLSLAKIVGVLALVVLILGYLFLTQCESGRRLAAQARVERSQGQAASDSARDAIGTQGAANARERDSEDLTRTNREDIRNAEGAGQAVPDPVDAAGRRALCLRRAYRDRPECKLLLAHPASLDGGR